MCYLNFCWTFWNEKKVIMKHLSWDYNCLFVSFLKSKKIDFLVTRWQIEQFGNWGKNKNELIFLCSLNSLYSYNNHQIYLLLLNLKDKISDTICLIDLCNILESGLWNESFIFICFKHIKVNFIQINFQWYMTNDISLKVLTDNDDLFTVLFFSFL